MTATADCSGKPQRTDIEFASAKSKMVEITYESPEGQVPLAHLWNGENARRVVVRLYEKTEGREPKWELVD